MYVAYTCICTCKLLCIGVLISNLSFHCRVSVLPEHWKQHKIPCNIHTSNAAMQDMEELVNKTGGVDSVDGDDKEAASYRNIGELWEKELGLRADAEMKNDDASKQALDEWYKKGDDYWSNTPATVDGVLGGYGHVSSPDIRDSAKFLKSLDFLQFGCAADCGAGIGTLNHGADFL